MTHRPARIWLVGLAFFGCAKSASVAPQPLSYRVDQAPEALQGAVAKADHAIVALQQRLAKRLFDELGSGGPVKALSVCRDEAQPLTEAVAQEQGVSVGRTSFKLRNPKNAPRAWARPSVERAAGQRAQDVEPLVFDLGDSVGVLRPIPLGGACEACHGPRESISPDVQGLLEASYPSDEAVGFQEGDLRGFFWAEAPKR